MVFKFISPVGFFISLVIGLFFVYLSHPSPDIIRVYPTPSNINDIQYKDRAGSCFAFKTSLIECPKDGLAKTIPIQN